MGFRIFKVKILLLILVGFCFIPTDSVVIKEIVIDEETKKKLDITYEKSILEKVFTKIETAQVIDTVVFEEVTGTAVTVIYDKEIAREFLPLNSSIVEVSKSSSAFGSSIIYIAYYLDNQLYIVAFLEHGKVYKSFNDNELEGDLTYTNVNDQKIEIIGLNRTIKRHVNFTEVAVILIFITLAALSIIYNTKLFNVKRF